MLGAHGRAALTDSLPLPAGPCTCQATLHAELVSLDHILPLTPAPLKDVTLYVTVEPCVMCASALRQVGIGRVVYGAGNDRFGGCGSVLCINSQCVPAHLALESARSAGTDALALHARRKDLDSFDPYEAVGGYFREEAIMALRRFYMIENTNGARHRRLTSSQILHRTDLRRLRRLPAPKPRKKATRVLKTDILPTPTGSQPPSRVATPGASDGEAAR